MKYGARGTGFTLRAIPLLLLTGVIPVVAAAEVTLPGIDIDIGDADIAPAIKILIALTILSLAPAIMISMTSFMRIIVVLSMLRHAFGMQQTPPNTVLISLALFLTIFSMLPALQQVQQQAIVPYTNELIETEQALEAGLGPLRDFMIRQTREQDLALMVDVSGREKPETVADIDTFLLVPAFMLSELKTAFQIGFVIFVPFVMIDIIVASILMSMGMLMVPPMMISLPIKVLMFVLIDGWNLVVQSLLSSFG
ncbi:MAG: flagellar type III secretion system pore protein FliP [Gammaproteobacteria bacterium]|nr:flagellar type III secretion system pore protein FliP [Gammaproteobacteria bacterium]